MTEDLVKRMREEASALQRSSWSSMDGGQDCCIAAALADEAADLIERLTTPQAGEVERLIADRMMLTDSEMRAGLVALSAAPNAGLVEAADEALVHFEELARFAQTRIDDGKEMGAAVWRIALEDIVLDALSGAKDLRAALDALRGG